MKFNKRDETEDPKVQMAPMLDCVFLLLIFFLVTASMRKPHRELSVLIPDSAVAPKPESKVEEVLFRMDQAGNIYLGDQAGIKDDQLNKILDNLAGTKPHVRIRIRCHARTRMAEVTKLVDTCMLYRLNVIGVRVED